MKKILMLTAVMMLLTVNSFAANWVKINDSLFINTDSIEQYVDRNSRKDYDKYSFWIQSINNGDEIWKNTELIYEKYGEKRKASEYCGLAFGL